MIVAYIAGIERRQDWIKILSQDSCGEGSFGGKFWGMPVGRVPSGRGFQDSLWEVPEEPPGSPNFFLFFFFGCPPPPRGSPSHSAAKAVIQPIRAGRSNRSGRSSQPSRPIQPSRLIRPERKKTPTAILFWREIQKMTMIMIYIYIYKPKRI